MEPPFPLAPQLPEVFPPVLGSWARAPSSQLAWQLASSSLSLLAFIVTSPALPLTLRLLSCKGPYDDTGPAQVTQEDLPIARCVTSLHLQSPFTVRGSTCTSSGVTVQTSARGRYSACHLARFFVFIRNINKIITYTYLTAICKVPSGSANYGVVVFLFSCPLFLNFLLYF